MQQKPIVLVWLEWYVGVRKNHSTLIHIPLQDRKYHYGTLLAQGTLAGKDLLGCLFVMWGIILRYEKRHVDMTLVP